MKKYTIIVKKVFRYSCHNLRMVLFRHQTWYTEEIIHFLYVCFIKTMFPSFAITAIEERY